MCFVLFMQGPAAQLFKFVADPPTTTMQRLRGIVTVWLPHLGREKVSKCYLSTVAAQSRRQQMCLICAGRPAHIC